MTDFLGCLGGVLYKAETAWNTAVVPDTTLWCIGSTLKPTHQLLDPEHLSFTDYGSEVYTPQYSMGEITTHWSWKDSIISDILGNMTAKSTQTFTFGAAAAEVPENPGLTITQNTGGADGMSWKHSGCKINSLELQVEPNKYPRAVLGIIGGTCVEDGSPAAITCPGISLMSTHADFGSMTFGGVSMGVLSCNIKIERRLTAADRMFVGGTTLTEPTPTKGSLITATFNVDLSDTTGRDTKAQIDKYQAGTTLGAISIGTTNAIGLTGCRMLGEWPSLTDGLQQFPISVRATACTMTSTA